METLIYLSKNIKSNVSYSYVLKTALSITSICNAKKIIPLIADSDCKSELAEVKLMV